MLMLEDERIPVGQIAEELHFSDQASFSKFFKKQMKMAPMLYRRKYEEK
ncbi:helix-turn-helix domain-containing protein [Phocaeicola barnesiae]|nr:helix-turn-helix domain-containing protein [Phocaeicola barnesiae]MDM8307733.1 AraC family transcriptional regulator [Phocaeicola barnesiae]